MSDNDLRKEIQSLNKKFDDLIDLVGQGRRPKSHVFTKEEISGMTPDEYMKNKDLIQAQLNRENDEKEKAELKEKQEAYYRWHEGKIQEINNLVEYVEAKEKMGKQGIEINDPEIEKSLGNIDHFVDGSEYAEKFMNRKPFTNADVGNMSLDQYKAFREIIEKQHKVGLVEMNSAKK